MHRTTMSAALLALGLAIATAASAAPLGTAFTYQGRLESNAAPVNGSYDLIFRLFDSAAGGLQVGADLPKPGISTTNGLFTVSLDFGASPFAGQGRWLDIQVKGPGDAGYTLLAPRQPLTAAPYALYALNGGGGTNPWSADGFGNITYTGGAAGVTGQSTHAATGVGVFFDGGNVNGGSVYGYDYGAGHAIPLYLNAPGASVLVGSVTTPGAKLDVLASSGPGVRATTVGSLFFPINAAVVGVGNTGTGVSGAPSDGVYASSVDAIGLEASSTHSDAIHATAQTGFGVMASSNTGDGVYGVSLGAGHSGVTGLSGSPGGQGGYFRNDGGGAALFADGLAKVRTLQILGGADLAERFETLASVEPGTVMAIDANATGRLEVAAGAYCRTVAGVVSGANGLAAGVELGKEERREGTSPIALSGRVWVKCDAAGGPIRPGDLLTTAERPGYAMRAGDRDRAPGAVLGKAMTSLEHGTGLVLVLVSLQ